MRAVSSSRYDDRCDMQYVDCGCEEYLNMNTCLQDAIRIWEVQGYEDVIGMQFIWHEFTLFDSRYYLLC